MEALQHNKEGGDLIGGVGAWFSTEFSRTVPLHTRLFNAHATIVPLLFILLVALHFSLVKQPGISPRTSEGDSYVLVHLRRMAGYGLLVFSLALVLSLIISALLGHPGADVTKPWWMFIGLFPAEAALGIRALVIVPAVLGLWLALVPVFDRNPYLSAGRRKGVLIVAGIVLVTMAVSGIVATLQPVSAHPK